MIIINGGITQNGNYNSEYYKIELDYLTGIAHIGRVRNSFTNTIQGTIDNSITVVNYAKNNYIAISIGGINDQTISNKIYTLDINRNILKEINTKSCEIKPRKGHTATLIKKTNITAFENNIIQYYDIIIFGGKNEKETLNDIIIIKIAYMTIDNTFYYSSVDHIKSYGDIPEPREGHHAIYMNDALYIIGGCDYIKGICYNKDIYKLEIENGKWVEVDKEEQHTNYTFGQYVANQMRNQILGAMEDSHLVRIPKSQQIKKTAILKIVNKHLLNKLKKKLVFLVPILGANVHYLILTMLFMF